LLVFTFLDELLDLCLVFAKRYDRSGEANEYKRAWISDPPLNAVLQFAPVCCRHTKPVRDKLIGPCLAKGDWILFPQDAFHHIPDLAIRRTKADPSHVVMRIDVVQI
jgi:hypothetical protein